MTRARHRRPEKKQQSPKGLLTNITKFGWDRQHGLWLEEIEPGKYTIRGPHPQQQITDYITNLRKFATALIEASGKKPADYIAIANGDVFDRACAAAAVLKQIDHVVIHLRSIERDFAGRSNPILIAVYEALKLATCIHQLTVVDNEIGIASTIDRRRQLKENRTRRAEQANQQHKHLQKLADEIWRQNPNWTASNVANEIAKKFGGNPNTMRRLIKK